MAAVAPGGKLVQTIKLSYLPSCPGALAWSEDDRIAVVTDQCVYILTLLSPNNTLASDMYIEKSTVSWHDKPICLDVGIASNIKRSTDLGCERIEWLFQPSLNPMICGNVNYNSFHSVAWSPPGMDVNHRCILATLSLDHQVFVHISNNLTRKWKRTIDITRSLQDYYHKHGFHLDSDGARSTTEINKTHHSFVEFKRRTNLLSITSLKWCPILFTQKSVDIEDIDSVKGFAVLATGMKSGHIIFWKIMASVLSEMTTAEVVGSVNSESSSTCSLAWHSPDYQQAGLLAVGDSNGLVQLFSLLVNQSCNKFEITSQTKYVVWGDRDEMAVNWLHWHHQRENGCLQLLASKGSTVIVFNISTVNGRLIEMPQHSFVSGIHSVGISGLGCSQNGLVTTCSTEGTVQSFSLDAGDSYNPVLIDKKDTHMCNGIAVSANGLYIAVLYSPASVSLQNITTCQAQISFLSVATEEKLHQVLTALKTCPSGTYLSWDVMEACRQAALRNNGRSLYDRLRETPTSTAVPCLYVRLFLETLLFNCTSVTVNSSSEIGVVRDWQVEQRCTADQILKTLVLSRLEQWNDTVEGVELSVLLMCDWLAAAFPEEQILELVASMYRRCGEENLAEITKSVAQHLASKPQSNYINKCQSIPTNTEAQIRLEENCKELGKELSESVNCSQSAAENGGVSLNNVTAKDTTVINSAERISTRESSEMVDNVRVVERRNGSLDDELLGAKCTPKLPPLGAAPAPPRETCVVCGSAAPLSPMNPLSSTCANGHTWQRCCASFLLCSDYEYRRCQTCGGCVRLSTKGLSPLVQAALRETQNCPFCMGWFT